MLCKDFQPWEKTQLKKFRIFSRVFEIAYQLLTYHSPFAPRWWMNCEAFTILNPKSFFGSFADFGCWNTEKSVSLRDGDVQTFLKRKENQKMERKTESYVFSGFDNGISRSWERKSTTGRFATGRFWPCTWKISSAHKDQTNNLYIKNYAHCLFL